MCLVALGVGPSWRRKGVGLLLMQDFMAKARELKMRSLVLSVLEDQKPARAFYEKCGWRPCVSTSGKSLAMKYCRALGQDAEGYESHHAAHGDNLGSCEESLQRERRRALMTAWPRVDGKWALVH
jgi:ribosomal protein S18 acetylase RimI-like enzyme